MASKVHPLIKTARPVAAATARVRVLVRVLIKAPVHQAQVTLSRLAHRVAIRARMAIRAKTAIRARTVARARMVARRKAVGAGTAAPTARNPSYSVVALVAR